MILSLCRKHWKGLGHNGDKKKGKKVVDKIDEVLNSTKDRVKLVNIEDEYE